MPAVTSDDLEEASINYGIPVPLEERPEDRKEAELIDEFSKQGCNCLRECSRFFSESDYALFRNHCTELDRESLDMVIMGQLISLTSNPDSQTTYMHKGQKVKTKNNVTLVILQFLTQTLNRSVELLSFSYIISVGKGLQQSKSTCQKMVLNQGKKTNILTS